MTALSVAKQSIENLMITVNKTLAFLMEFVKIQVEENSSKNEDNVQREHQNENPGGRNSGVFYFLFRRNYFLCWLSLSMYLSSSFPTR